MTIYYLPTVAPVWPPEKYENAHVFLIRKHEFSRPENSRTWHSLLSVMSTLEPNSKILLSQEPKPPCTSVLRHTPFILGLVLQNPFFETKSNLPRLRRNSSLGFSFILVCQALNKSTFFLPLNWSSMMLIKWMIALGMLQVGK